MIFALIFSLIIGLGESKTIDNINYYLCKTQTYAGPVGKEFYSTKEQALCAIAFLKRGHYNRAKKILNFYHNIYRTQKTQGEFVGFYERYDIKGSSVSGLVECLSQLCLAQAVIYYTSKTQDRTFLPMAQDVAYIFERSINRWGTFVESDSQMYVQKNLFAYSLFSQLYNITKSPKYLTIAKRTLFVLEDLFLDNQRKMLRHKIFKDEFAQRDQIFGKIIFHKDLSLLSETPKTLEEIAWYEFASAVGGKKRTYRLEENLRFTDTLEGEFISDKDSASVNLVATVLYLFIKEDFNPFAAAEIIKHDELAITPRGEEYETENFEDDTMGFYAIKPPRTLNSKIKIEYESKIKKEGQRGLKIQFTSLKNEKSTAEVTRVFYPPQDFTKFRRLKFWLNARTSNPIPGILGLKLKLKVVDTAGNIGESNFLNHTTRGVENTIVIPNGFSFAEKTSVDLTKVKEMIWYFEENTQTSWNIIIDDIRME